MGDREGATLSLRQCLLWHGRPGAQCLGQALVDAGCRRGGILGTRGESGHPFQAGPLPHLSMVGFVFIHPSIHPSYKHPLRLPLPHCSRWSYCSEQDGKASCPHGAHLLLQERPWPSKHRLREGDLQELWVLMQHSWAKGQSTAARPGRRRVSLGSGMKTGRIWPRAHLGERISGSGTSTCRSPGGAESPGSVKGA